MLKVYIGEKQGSLGIPDAWFDVEFDKGKLLTDWSKNVVLRLDGSNIFDKEVMISPIFGGIPTSKLSTGLKNLLLAKYNPELMINWVYMGENCLNDLFNIAKESDLEVCAECYYDPYTYGYKGNIVILNDGTVVKDSDEFFDKWLEYRRY